MQVLDIVKFNTKSRFSEWDKGDLAQIKDTLVSFPANQATVYLAETLKNRSVYWVYEAEITPYWEQLTLF